MLESHESLLRNTLEEETILSQLDQLQQLLQQLIPAVVLKDLTERIQSQLPRHLGADAVTLYLYDPKQELLITDGFEDLNEISDSYLETHSSLIPEILRRCLYEKKSIVLEDCLHSDEILPDVLFFKGVQSALFLYLGVKRRMYGVLQVEYIRKSHKFSDQEVHFYENVADIISCLMENCKKIQEQKQRHSVWRETEESYYQFFESAPIGLFRSTPDGALLRVNQAVVKMLKYSSREALLSVPVPSLYASAKEYEKWKTELESNDTSNENEIQLRCADGSMIWVRHNVKAMRASDGRVLYYDGSIADISERLESDQSLKEAYREKELLLKEIHHRVKNNLQIISSLLNLQSDYLRDPFDAELFKQSQARVKAMALLHEKLYQSSDLAHIDFGDYIHSLVVHLFQSYTTSSVNIGYSIDADNIHFDIDTAIPCGLIVGELVSNCLKHAFVGRKEGHVWISVGHLDSRTIRLSVADNGVGMKEQIPGEKSASLGLELVKTLSEQLAAVLDIQRKDGTRVTLLFKEKVHKEGGKKPWEKQKS